MSMFLCLPFFAKQRGRVIESSYFVFPESTSYVDRLHFTSDSRCVEKFVGLIFGG